MKKMFLMSSFKHVAELFFDFAGNVEGKKVTFISTAALIEKVDFFVKSSKKIFNKMGMIVDELELSVATEEEITRKLETNEYIYVSGGNTYFLLQELKKKGADKIIKQQIELGKMYIGESAGAMVLSHDLEFAKSMDNIKKAPSLRNLKGVGAIDFYPVPHYMNIPYKRIVKKIIADYEHVLPLIPISNKQAILIENGILRIENI